MPRRPPALPAARAQHPAAGPAAGSAARAPPSFPGGGRRRGLRSDGLRAGAAGGGGGPWDGRGSSPAAPRSESRVARPAGPAAVVRVIFLLSAVSSEWPGQRLRSGDETGGCCVTVMKRIRLSGGVSAPAADYSIHDRSSVKFKFDSLRRTDPNLNGPSSFLSGPRRCVSNFRSADNNLKNLNTRQAAGPGRWPGPSGPGPTVSVQPGTQGLYLQ